MLVRLEANLADQKEAEAGLGVLASSAHLRESLSATTSPCSGSITLRTPATMAPMKCKGSCPKNRAGMASCHKYHPKRPNVRLVKLAVLVGWSSGAAGLWAFHLPSKTTFASPPTLTPDLRLAPCTGTR